MIVSNRGRSRSLGRSNIELPMAKANGGKPSTIIKENSTSDLAGFLDPTLMIIKMVYKLKGVIRKTSAKTKSSKTSKYNISIVEQLHRSKNESSGSQDHTEKPTIKHFKKRVEERGMNTELGY